MSDATFEDVETEQTETVMSEGENGQSTIDTSKLNGRYTVTLPDLKDTTSVQSFLDELSKHESQYGVRTLRKNITKYLQWQETLDKKMQVIQTNVKSVNGEPKREYVKTSDLPEAERQLRSLKLASKRYFEVLLNQSDGTNLIRMQCKLFGVDYTAYESLDETIDALVEKQLEMATK